jgi:hypothetical protein
MAPVARQLLVIKACAQKRASIRRRAFYFSIGLPASFQALKPWFMWSMFLKSIVLICWHALPLRPPDAQWMM